MRHKSFQFYTYLPGTIYYNPCEMDAEGRMSIINENAVDETKSLMVYPNPASERITLNYQIETTDIAVFEIFNLLGEKVISYALDASHNEQSLSIAELNAGAYMYQFNVNGINIKANKLVIVN